MKSLELVDISIEEFDEMNEEHIFSKTYLQKKKAMLKEYRKGMYRNKVKYVKVAAAFAVLVVSGPLLVNAAVNGERVGRLFYNIWELTEEEVESQDYSRNIETMVGTNFSIMEENNEFQDIEIEPIQVLSDRYSYYIVLKVEGVNGFVLPEDTVLSGAGCNDKSGMYDVRTEYFLKRDGNAMYYAFQGMGNMKDDQVEFSMKVELAHGDINKNGTMSVQGSDIEANGNYCATIKTEVHSEMVTIKEEDAEYDIYPLSVNVRGDFEANGNKHFVVLEDGSKISIRPMGEASGKVTECMLKEPVDITKIAGIEIAGKFFDSGRLK